jgi:hypothetical protein
MSTLPLPLNTCGPVPPEAIYPDPDTCFATIQAYAQVNGYTLIKRSIVRDKRTKVPYKYIYTCDREGLNSTERTGKGKDPDIHKDKRRNTGSKKCGYKMKVHLMK